MSLRGKSSSYTKQADTQHYSSWFLILTFKITGRDLQRHRPQAVHLVWSSCLQEPHTLDKLDVWNTLQNTEWGPGSQRLPAFPRLTTQPSSKSPCLTFWQQRWKERKKTKKNKQHLGQNCGLIVEFIFLSINTKLVRSKYSGPVEHQGCLRADLFKTLRAHGWTMSAILTGLLPTGLYKWWFHIHIWHFLCHFFFFPLVINDFTNLRLKQTMDNFYIYKMLL